MTAPVKVFPAPGDPNIGTVATIANGASLSGALDLGSMRLAGVLMPAAWTAAGLTFQASYDNVTYFNVFGDAAEYAVASAAASVNNFVAVDRTKFASVRFIKVRSGTSGTPVNQGAQRLLPLVLLPSAP